MSNPNAHLDFDLDTLGGLPLPRHIVFSIGSNLGDRLEYLQGAVDALRATPQLTVTGVSAVYETAPVGPVTDQPDFLNIVVTADSTLASLVLLERAQAIENAFRRVREIPGGPRTLDVDLIAVGERIKNTVPLTLPHPRAGERAFVLVPWHDVEPEAALPGGGPIAELIAGLDVGVVRRRADLVIE